MGLRWKDSLNDLFKQNENAKKKLNALLYLPFSTANTKGKPSRKESNKLYYSIEMRFRKFEEKKNITKWQNRFEILLMKTTHWMIKLMEYTRLWVSKKIYSHSHLKEEINGKCVLLCYSPAIDKSRTKSQRTISNHQSFAMSMANNLLYSLSFGCFHLIPSFRFVQPNPCGMPNRMP